MGRYTARGVVVGCGLFIGLGSFIAGIILWVLGARAVKAINAYDAAVTFWSPAGYTRFLEWATGSSMTPASTNALSNLAATITPDLTAAFTVAGTSNTTLTYTYGLPDQTAISVASGVDLTKYPLSQHIYTSWVSNPGVANSTSFGPATKPYFSYGTFGMTWLNIYLDGIQVGHMPMWLSQEVTYLLSACQSSSSSTSGSIINAASCLAARSSCNTIGDFGFARGTCTVNVRLSGVCVALPDSLLRSAAAAGPSWSSVYLDPFTYGCSPWYDGYCSPQYGQTCYSAPRYTVNPRNNFNGAADFSGVPVEVRSADDPYVVAVQATNGQMRFSDGPSMLLAGEILTPIGIVFFGVPFTALMLWILFTLLCKGACRGGCCRCRRRASHYNPLPTDGNAGASLLRPGTSNSFGNTTSTPSSAQYNNRQTFRERGREVSRSLRSLVQGAGLGGANPAGKNQKDAAVVGVIPGSPEYSAPAYPPVTPAYPPVAGYPPVAATYPPVATYPPMAGYEAASAPPADQVPGL